MVTPLWLHTHFVVLDVEGNGALQPEIVELALIHIRDGRLEASRHWMVRPRVPVTLHAKRLHGIRNENLDEQPPFAQIVPELIAELGSAAVVGHHVGVDMSLLRRQLPDWHPPTCIDTLRLAKHAFPDAGNYALQSLYKSLVGGEDFHGHRALEDAQMTARLFLSITAKLSHDMHLDLLALARLGASQDDPLLQAQQGRLF